MREFGLNLTSVSSRKDEIVLTSKRVATKSLADVPFLLKCGARRSKPESGIRYGIGAKFRLEPPEWTRQ